MKTWGHPNEYRARKQFTRPRLSVLCDERVAPGYRFEGTDLSLVFAAVLKRDAGVTLLADRRLAKPAIDCSHRSEDTFSACAALASFSIEMISLTRARISSECRCGVRRLSRLLIALT